MKDLKYQLQLCKKELIRMIKDKTEGAGADGFGCGDVFFTYIIYDVFALFLPCKIKSIHPKFVKAIVSKEEKSIFIGEYYKPIKKLITISYENLDIGTLQLILMQVGGPHVDDW
jgi:hypothetical protein